MRLLMESGVPRPSKHETFIEVARVLAKRATCSRRQVGCVLVDVHGRILSTGYNGNPPGLPHCIDKPCAGSQCPSGQGLDLCEATHAEINALLFCPDIKKIHTAYLTVSPCIQCVKALATTSCNEIYFIEEYVGAHSRAKEIWCNGTRGWNKL